jgi:hypothetical protein
VTALHCISLQPRRYNPLCIRWHRSDQSTVTPSTHTKPSLKMSFLFLLPKCVHSNGSKVQVSSKYINSPLKTWTLPNWPQSANRDGWQEGFPSRKSHHGKGMMKSGIEGTACVIQYGQPEYRNNEWASHCAAKQYTLNKWANNSLNKWASLWTYGWVATTKASKLVVSGQNPVGSANGKWQMVSLPLRLSRQLTQSGDVAAGAVGSNWCPEP